VGWRGVESGLGEARGELQWYILGRVCGSECRSDSRERDRWCTGRSFWRLGSDLEILLARLEELMARIELFR
jgi:hypothetical protein